MRGRVSGTVMGLRHDEGGALGQGVTSCDSAYIEVFSMFVVGLTVFVLNFKKHC